MAATGNALITTCVVADVAAQPLLTATALVTVYVPGWLLASVRAPVLTFNPRPAGEALNVPAEALLPSVGAMAVPATGQ